MDVRRFKNVSKNKLIFILDRDYHNYLIKVISNAMSQYFGIPETIEDIYWLFMFEVSEIIGEFSGQTEREFVKFLGLKCKFFTFSHCKKMINPANSVLNNAVSFEESHSPATDEDEIALHDSIKEMVESIDINLLDERELKIYKNYFIDGKHPKDIARSFNITVYSLKIIIEEVRKKLQKSIKK